MQVVRHEAIGIKIEGKFGFLLLEDGRKLQVIIVRSEYLSTIISASDYVIEPAADFDSWLPGHYGRESRLVGFQMSSNASLTPPCAVSDLQRRVQIVKERGRQKTAAKEKSNSGSAYDSSVGQSSSACRAAVA
jgi:hypothetical protein